jgi:anion-transporting  ArsA/GET3 family ATPase
VPGIEGGHLSAMMLDMKRTFDEIVESHADPERSAAILENPFYQALSSSFAGTQEYMAMEKLGQLKRASDTGEHWDLIVVDTPPSRSALDFLDAPKRLGSFLDGRLIRVLAAPARGAGRMSARVFSASLGLFTGAMSKILGGQVLRDVQLFVTSFDALFGGFRERAEQTYAQLQAPDTRFIVVAAPESDALREASYFVQRLETERMPLAGLVLNRVHESAAPGLSAEQSLVAADRLAGATSHPLVVGLLRLHAERMQRISRERRLVGRFTAAFPKVRIATARAQASDIHDLDGLRRVAADLAGSAE